MKLELNLESPYTATGEPRQDLPTGEVLAFDGEQWASGFLTTWGIEPDGVILMSAEEKLILNNVQRFAALKPAYAELLKLKP